MIDGCGVLFALVKLLSSYVFHVVFGVSLLAKRFFLEPIPPAVCATKNLRPNTGRSGVERWSMPNDT